jgi:hypothetical protein
VGPGISPIIAAISARQPLLIRQEQYRNLRPDQLPTLVKGLQLVAETVSVVPSGEG